MVTKAKIDRLCHRIEALAAKSDRVSFVWKNVGETEDEVLERHYREVPADRFARQLYVFSWQGEGAGRKNLLCRPNLLAERSKRL